MKRLFDDLGFILILAVSLLTLTFIAFPIIISLLMSFDARNYLGRLPPTGFSLQWYGKFFSSEYFMGGLKTSLIIAPLTTAVSASVGIMTAVTLSHYDFKGKSVLSSLFLSPLMMPGIVIGFALLLFFAMFGIFSGFVRLLCGYIIITLPYTIRSTLSGLTGIRPSLREAAMSLGASERQAFWDITFPLAKTGIIGGCIFAFAVSFDDVAVGLFLYDVYTYTLPIALIGYMRANFDLSIAAATSVLAASTFLLILVVDWAVGIEKVIGRGIYRT